MYLDESIHTNWNVFVYPAQQYMKTMQLKPQAVTHPVLNSSPDQVRAKLTELVCFFMRSLQKYNALLFRIKTRFFIAQYFLSLLRWRLSQHAMPGRFHKKPSFCVFCLLRVLASISTLSWASEEFFPGGGGTSEFYTIFAEIFKIQVVKAPPSPLPTPMYSV